MYAVEKNKQVISNCQHLCIVKSSLVLYLSFPSKKHKPFGAEALADALA